MTRDSVKFEQLCEAKGLNARLIKDLSKRLEQQLFQKITEAIGLHHAGGMHHIESLAAIVQAYLGVQFKVLTLAIALEKPERRKASLEALRKDFNASFDDVLEAAKALKDFDT